MANWYEGPWVGPGAKFQVCVGYSYDTYTDDTVHMYWKRFIKVDGNFYGTTVHTSWAGDITLNGSGDYADTGWQDLGAVPYGHYDSTGADAWYTSGSGTTYESSGRWGEYATAPTWTPYPVKVIVATRASDDRTDLSWQNDAHGARPYSGIYVDRQVDGGSWSLIANISGGSTSFADASTSANHAYRYRVVPYNDAGQPDHALSGTVYNTPCAPTFASVARKDATTVTATLSNEANTATALEYQSRKMGGSSWGEWGATSSMSGKVASFDVDLGGGTFQLRARNTRIPLASDWALSEPVVTICAPAAPTLVSPASSAVVSKTSLKVGFEWMHNALDGSAQTKAELRYSTDGGSTWATVAVDGDGQSAEVDNSFALNSTVTWCVRTKGAHDDFGPWSGNRVFAVKQVPTVVIEQPPEGYVVEEIPIAIELMYSDPSGELESARMTILDDGGSAVYSEDMGTSTRCDVGASEFVPEDGKAYTIEASVRSSSTLTATATRAVTVKFVLPQRADIGVDFDQEQGFAYVTPKLADDEGFSQVVRIDLFRVNGSERVLIGEDVESGEVVLDRYAPLNVPYSYESVTHSASGSVNKTNVACTFATPWWYIYFDGGIAKAMWEPSGSRTPRRPADELKEIDGREWPLLIQGRRKSYKVSFSGWVESRDEADTFVSMTLASGDKVYKDLEGHVFHCHAEADVTDDYDGFFEYSATVGVSITRVSGGAL